MTIRIERAHRYEWWTPNVSGPGAHGEVRVSEEEGTVFVAVEHSDEHRPRRRHEFSDDVQLPTQSIPALILALQSFQERIGAAENEA